MTDYAEQILTVQIQILKDEYPNRENNIIQKMAFKQKYDALEQSIRILRAYRMAAMVKSL